MTTKIKTTDVVPFIRCVACDIQLGKEHIDSEDGLCAKCRKSLLYYDFPYINLEYVCGTLTEGLAEAPDDYYDHD